MTTAGAVAAELRRIADALDKEPGTKIKRPNMFFSHWTGEKDLFLNLVGLLPHPFDKAWDSESLTLQYLRNALHVYATIPRAAVCTLKEPAKPAVYECEPMLSQEEEASLGTV